MWFIGSIITLIFAISQNVHDTYGTVVLPMLQNAYDPSEGLLYALSVSNLWEFAGEIFSVIIGGLLCGMLMIVTAVVLRILPKTHPQHLRRSQGRAACHDPGMADGMRWY